MCGGAFIIVLVGVVCVGGGGGGQNGGAKQPADQPTRYHSHLAMHQHIKYTAAQHERGGALLDVLKKKSCNLLEPTCSGGSPNNWLERHRRNKLQELNRNKGCQKSESHTCSGGNLWPLTTDVQAPNNKSWL